MKSIPLSVPNFEGNEQKYVNDAVAKTWVSTGGAYITQLEKMLADYLNVESVAACQSGTSALHMALRLCGVKPGDMVIVPTLTFIAAVNPVKYQFAEPVFMDCDDSLCMDLVKLRKFCEEECELRQNSRMKEPTMIDGFGSEIDCADYNHLVLYHKNTNRPIKAIVVVHVFGNMADMEAIMDIANEYYLKVVEDATEALGTKYLTGRYSGRYAGTIGDFGAYSFNGNKIITTGGGGALTAKNPKDADHARYLSTQAKDDPHYYIHDEIGYNYRMTNVQAALGVAQMELLPEFINRKQRNYEKYSELLNGYEKGYLMGFRDNVSSNKWFYSLVVDPDTVKDSIKQGDMMRNIINSLAEKGIQTRTIWGLINEQKPYKDCTTYEIEKAEYYSRRVINLPCSTNITDEDIEYVVNCIREIL